MGCFNWVILAIVFVLVMVSLMRWFEQTVEAVDSRDWNRLAVLVAFPFAVWWYGSNVPASRPTPVPRHEPVRGFGSLPRGGIVDPPMASPADQPPPGTPLEYLSKPVPPPAKPKSTKPPIDPEQIEKLRRKMTEQGMIDPPKDE